MNSHQITAAMLWILFVLASLGASAVNAGDVFFDDFEDGSVTNDIPLASDGTPVKWTTPANTPGDYDASSGDFVLTPTAESAEFLVSRAQDFSIADTSVRSQVRVSTERGAAILTARNQDLLDSQQYFGGIGYFPDNGGTILFMGRNDPGAGRIFFPDASAFPVALDVLHEDAIIQMDVIGDEVSLWAWQAGDPMPAGPQLVAHDATYASGPVGLASTPVGVNNTTVFRYIQVADAHIPEPTSASLLALGAMCLLRRRRVRG